MTSVDGRPALGSATHAATPMDQRTPWGSARFHPPGEHPATYRYRWHRDRIKALLDRSSPFTDGYAQACEALAYIERKLSEFEAGEDEAKRIAWLRFHDRRKDRSGDSVADNGTGGS